eukprot:2261831-Amphidinium_carterae.1
MDNGYNYYISYPESYYNKILKPWGLHKPNSNSLSTTGQKLTAASNDSANTTLSSKDAETYRTTMGQLLWVSRLRPDISFSTKELARHLHHPCQQNMSQLKHLLRYISGTKGYTIQLQPKAPQTTQQGLLPLTINTFSDSDWASCVSTRMSTSSFVTTLFNCPITWAIRTQSTIATSSAEAELYAIGTSMAESIFIKQLLEEINNPAFASVKIDINIMTDSSAGK